MLRCEKSLIQDQPLAWMGGMVYEYKEQENLGQNLPLDFLEMADSTARSLTASFVREKRYQVKNVCNLWTVIKILALWSKI